VHQLQNDKAGLIADVRRRWHNGTRSASNVAMGPERGAAARADKARARPRYPRQSV
jgi:hypothetical protein